MRRLLSVAPCPSLAGYAPRLRATARYHQPAAAWRWTKLVAPGADAGVHHLVDVYSGNFTNDDQFHPHHYCFWFIA